MTKRFPSNLVHAALAELDPKMLTSPDAERIDVSLEAIAELLANPPPMLGGPAVIKGTLHGLTALSLQPGRLVPIEPNTP